MSRIITTVTTLLITLMCGAAMTTVGSGVGAESDAARPSSSEAFVLALPKASDPLVVRVRFDLYDVNGIDDGTETFEFTGVLTLKWHDPRSAFDPVAVGVDEKVFTGNFQFDEISPGWYPQLVLVNEAGLFQKSGVVLRVQPDGTSTLIEKLNAAAESELQMRRFPFDRQRLEAVFEVLGFDKDEIRLELESDAVSLPTSKVGVPQWDIERISASVGQRPAPYAGPLGISSAFVVSVDVQRRPLYLIRIVVLPLMIIVLLSFSVFWMERSSLGDRLSVSFIGILTAVAYLMVTSDQLPRIAYITLIHGFLNLSFVVMCATVAVNLAVSVLDRRGDSELGHRVDRVCRWAFPIAYFGLLLVMAWIAFRLL